MAVPFKTETQKHCFEIKVYLSVTKEIHHLTEAEKLQKCVYSLSIRHPQHEGLHWGLNLVWNADLWCLLVRCVMPSGFALIEDIRFKNGIPWLLIFLLMAESERTAGWGFTFLMTMSCICVWTIKHSVIFTEQHCIIPMSSNPSHSCKILARSLFYSSIIGLVASLLPPHWLFICPLNACWQAVSAQVWSLWVGVKPLLAESYTLPFWSSFSSLAYVV